VRAARVSGFIDKNLRETAELEHGLRMVSAGQTYFSSSYYKAQRRREESPGDYDLLLTERERDVLALTARAMSDAEIAAFLGMALRTVETHRSRIMRKLDLHSTPKLMKFALDRGFGQFGDENLPAANCMA